MDKWGYSHICIHNSTVVVDNIVTALSYSCLHCICVV